MTDKKKVSHTAYMRAMMRLRRLKQKEKEKEYRRAYYQKNKDKWKQYAKNKKAKQAKM